MYIYIFFFKFEKYGEVRLESGYVLSMLLPCPIKPHPKHACIKEEEVGKIML